MYFYYRYVISSVAWRPMHKHYASFDVVDSLVHCIVYYTMEAPPRVSASSAVQGKVPKAGGHLLEAAVHILEKVNREHGSGDAYLDKIWGHSIIRREAVCTLKGYSKSEHLSDILRIRTSSSLGCSAHVVSYGSPQRKLYHVTVDCSGGNCYLREKAILGLAFHEIGTHVVST